MSAMNVFDRHPRASAVKWSYRLLGAALTGLAVQEMANGHLRGHAGELWLRHLAFIPLLPPPVAVLLWILQIACGAAIALGLLRRHAVRVSAAILCVSLTQCWFNQKMLLALTFLALALDPPEPDRTDFEAAANPVLGLVQAQLLLVYAASVAYKLRDGFQHGEPLLAVFTQLSARGLHGLGPTATLGAWLAASPTHTSWLSIAVLTAEATVPLLLVVRPRAGFYGVVVLHSAMALLMPGLWPFSATMAGAAALYRAD
jgi:hypothetical protein